MANREIEARLKMTAVDQASRVIDKLGNRIDALGRKMETVNRKQIAANEAEAASARAAAAAQKNRAIILGAASVAAYAAARTMKTAIVDYAALEREITRIGITADASDTQIKSVSETIMKMAQDTATPLSDVYDGFDALVSAGRSWDEALSFLPSVVKTAQAAGAETRDIAATADAMAGSMHIAGSEMQEAFDKLAKGGKMGKFELKDMASYLPSILPQMAALGYSGLDGLEKTVAMLQTVRLQTGTASEAATNLENVLGKIYSPETARAFKKQFNIDLPKSLKAAKDSGKDLLDAFLQITRKATGGKMENLAKVFTDQQFRAGVMALLQQEEAMKGYAAGPKDAVGTIENDLGRVIKNTQADIDRLSNSWDGFLNNLGKTAVSIGVAKDIDSLGKDLDWLGRVVRSLGGDGSLSTLWSEHKLQGMIGNDPGAKAYADAYSAANGGKLPTPEQVAPYMAGSFDFLIGGKSEKDLAAAGAAGGRAGALADQYRLRGDTGMLPVSFSSYRRGPDAGTAIPGGVLPLSSGQFSGTAQYDPLSDPGAMLPGAYPKSDLSSFDQIQGRFGELTTELVNNMANAHREVVNELDRMAKDMVQIVGGITLPPIKVRVEGQPQLARVNPGVSMPDQ